MAGPFFYITAFDSTQPEMVLDEETSKHIVQVLRMKTGEQINLTDGKGHLLTAAIMDDHKKHCRVEIKSEKQIPKSKRNTTIAISILKNANRIEWFLEKAAEIGITQIIPLICERTEKEKFRQERMGGIIISAMLQSQQCWMPELWEPLPFKRVVQEARQQQKFIAHCLDETKANLSDLINDSLNSQIILIGPEGDFTKDEIDFAFQHHFSSVSLGDTRLRAETAGMVAATLLRLV